MFFLHKIFPNRIKVGFFDFEIKNLSICYLKPRIFFTQYHIHTNNTQIGFFGFWHSKSFATLFNFLLDLNCQHGHTCLLSTAFYVCWGFPEPVLYSLTRMVCKMYVLNFYDRLSGLVVRRSKC